MDENIFLHPSDKKALDALKALPGFDRLTRLFMKQFNEKIFYGRLKSSSVKIDEKRMQTYQDMLKDICRKLEIDVPELLIISNKQANAFTSGESRPFIVMTSALLDKLNDDVIYVVLAHECGHIACHHVLYRTLAGILLSTGLSVFAPGISFLVSIPIKNALLSWMRCSELSADRAAMLCDGTDKHLIDMCMRFNGFSRIFITPFDREAFLDKARKKRESEEKSEKKVSVSDLIFSYETHPDHLTRALTAREYFRSKDYARARDYLESLWRHEVPKGMVLMKEDPASYIGKDPKDVSMSLYEQGFINTETEAVTSRKELASKVVSLKREGHKDLRQGDLISLFEKITIAYGK